jgi:hypothetical protein
VAKTPAFLVSILSSCLLAACAGDMPDDEELAPDPAGEGVPEGEIARPDHSITLPNGNSLRFYAWADGSAGVLEVGLSANLSALAFGDLGDASAAELFWAASDGADVPEIYMTHHRELAAKGDRRSWSDATAGRPRGWLRAEIEAAAAPAAGDVETQALSDCHNATFKANHCLPDANYTNDKCFLDRTSNVTWISSLSRRYKAGVCVSDGFIHDKLSYQAVTDYCGGLQPPVVIWDQNYSPGGYTTWTWWGTQSQSSRKWTHAATSAGAGDVFDHGQKWRHYECVP